MPITSNAVTVMSNLEKRLNLYKDELAPAMKIGARLFEGYIVKTQMTGRPGLNRKTGTLARSTTIKLQPMKSGPRINLLFGAKNAPYVVVHQGKKLGPGKYSSVFEFTHTNLYGRGIQARIRIPKRLFIPERWEDKGRDLMVKQIAKALQKLTQ